MKCGATLVLLLGVACFAAVPDLVVKGLSFALLDADGRPTRKLVAREVSGTPDEPKLRDGAVEFFAPELPKGPPIGRLEFDTATYIASKHSVVGDGEMRLHSTRGNAAGTGCTYDITKNQLEVRRGFRLTMANATITGDEADLTLANEKGELVVIDLDVRGHVIATPADPKKYPFERVRSEHAWYRAAAGILHVAPPVWIMRDGHESPSEANEIALQFGK